MGPADARAEDERKHRIRPLEKEGWEYLPPNHEDYPGWINIPNYLQQHIGLKEYKYEIYHGDTFVYKVVSGVHGTTHVFRKLKSDYFKTTPQKGTCPNCQSYVKRYDDDEYLTCHRCGWQYNPLEVRLKNESITDILKDLLF
jgi:ribosomal protein L37AE/L43A